MSERKSKLWLLFREATAFDMKIADPYNTGIHSPGGTVVLHAYAFEKSLIDDYISSHRGLRLFLKKEKHTDDYMIEFERMNLTQKVQYWPLRGQEDGRPVEYPVAMTYSERITLDNYQRRPSMIFTPEYDYMNMSDKIHGALLDLKYNEFFNDARFGDDTIQRGGNNTLNTGFYINEFWLFQKMIRESPAYNERR